MSSSTNLELALEKEMAEVGMVEGSPSIFIQWFRKHLTADPALIEELVPGMMLVRKPMTPKERATMAIPAMNTARKVYHEEMVAALAPVISDIRRLKADANGHEIAITLNTTAYGPSKSRKEWTYADVRRLLKELKIDPEPTAP